MPRKERTWHPDFMEYMELIAGHENYEGLPISRKDDGELKWITTGNSEMGKQRKRWAERKARELNYPIKPGVYSRVMREIHPNKIHVCQICGSKMSIYYLYPSVNFLKALQREFNIEFSECDNVYDIWDILLEEGNSMEVVSHFFCEKFNIDCTEQNSKKDILEACERLCREEGKRLLSPGAMSDFPDRFDGFHTYNRCCRAEKDKGRSKENLKSYTKDRRAFEYWSDGNIHAANMFMGSSFFEGTSADHIGPISLGFIHDPRYLQPMTSGKNSTKRDRLLPKDIDKILFIESRTNVYPMTWYSAKIWEYIKENYQSRPEFVPSIYRNLLKQNMANFMYILYIILESCGEAGREFLLETIIKPKYEYFTYTYEFNSLGEITHQSSRHFTERSRNEMERFTRIAFQSVYDYNYKENRHISSDLTRKEKKDLTILRVQIIKGQPNFSKAYEALNYLMTNIQVRLIGSCKNL